MLNTVIFHIIYTTCEKILLLMFIGMFIFSCYSEKKVMKETDFVMCHKNHFCGLENMCIISLKNKTRNNGQHVTSLKKNLIVKQNIKLKITRKQNKNRHRNHCLKVCYFH